MGTPRTIRKEFDADQFTATKFDTAADKATAMEQLARFAEAGFPHKAFTKRLYHHLYQHLFHHIAHYDRDGFYHTWFSTLDRQADWVDYALRSRAFGDPAWTWCDAEEAFQGWLADSGIPELVARRAADAKEAAERAALARLLAKYPDAAGAATEEAAA